MKKNLCLFIFRLIYILPMYHVCNNLHWMWLFCLYTAIIGCFCTIITCIITNKDVSWKLIAYQFFTGFIILCISKFIFLPLFYSIIFTYSINFWNIKDLSKFISFNLDNSFHSSQESNSQETTTIQESLSSEKVNYISEWVASTNNTNHPDIAKSSPSSVASINKDSPTARSANSGETRSMNPSVTDSHTFIIPGFQLHYSYNHNISFQPSASMLAWHLETWDKQGNTELIPERFSPACKRWFLQMLEVDFPARYYAAIITKPDGTIDRYIDGYPKINFSAIRNNEELRSHLRSIK